jgi:hypothetical protein
MSLPKKASFVLLKAGLNFFLRFWLAGKLKKFQAM